jgi:hypothetical protein
MGEFQIVINVEKMNSYLHERRLHYTCDEFFTGYQNHIPKFNPQLVANMQLQDFRIMSQVFDFIGITVPDMRKELTVYLRHYWPSFWGLNMSQIYDKMVQTLVAQPPPRPPKINWIPQFGGMVKPKPSVAKEQKWHERNEVPYAFHDSQEAAVDADAPLPPREALHF